MRSQGADHHETARALARGDLDAADLSPADRAMLDYAEKLTRDPARVTAADLNILHTHGFTGPQCWEIAFTASIFNLFPRMAEAFGITPDPAWTAAPRIEWVSQSRAP